MARPSAVARFILRVLAEPQDPLIFNLAQFFGALARMLCMELLGTFAAGTD
jgi:hypothetical protein